MSPGAHYRRSSFLRAAVDFRGWSRSDWAVAVIVGITGVSTLALGLAGFLAALGVL